MMRNVIRRGAIVAVAVPLAAASARRMNDMMQSRRRASGPTMMLRRAANSLRQAMGRTSRRSQRRWR